MGNVASVATRITVVAQGVIHIMRYIRQSRMRENSTLRNLNYARNGQEYMQRFMQAARQEVETARQDADQARMQAAAALRQAEQARRQAEEAIVAVEQARRQARLAPGTYSTNHRADRAFWIQQARRGQVELSEFDTEYEAAFSETTAEGIETAEERSLAAIEEDIERAEREAEAARQVAREETKRARGAQEAAERIAKEAKEKVEAAKQAQKEAEECLKKGIQPIVLPSPQEVSAARERMQYQDGLFHFAVAGVSGSGKSSLINAFRGLHNKDAGAARTGIVETTSTIDRYPDPNPRNPFVWYDIPGAGTLQQSDWLYFNSQGLFVFDCIIVLFDARFTATDIAILTNCRRFQIPTYIVRSKADAHIRNIMRDLGYESESDDRARRTELYTAAREQYIAETRATVQRNLKDAGLTDQRVYIACNTTVLSTVKNLTLSPKTIDELDLMRDLLEEAHSRRCVPQRNL